ncbi:MAG: flippase [bacterium]|nr:flippase [bacterium]
MSRPDVRVGTAYLLAAQLIFLVSGYGMHVFLGRYLGPAEYGLFGVVLYAATMIRTFVMSGVPMAVARYVAAEPNRAEAILRQGLRLQFLLAFTVSLIFFLLAEPLAKLLGDPSLTILFRIAAPITIFFGIFFVINQYHNGLGQYRLQSAWLTLSYLLRAVLVIGLTWVGWRVYGAVAGLTIAAALSSLIVLFIRKAGAAGPPFPPKLLIDFGAPLIVASIVFALITDLDMMFVKGMMHDTVSAGYYTSAKAMAQATPFAFYALSSALYPAISRVQAQGDIVKMQNYIHQANRLLLITILPLLVIVCFNSQAILQLFYGSKFLPAATSLSWLMLSFSFMSIFVIHRTFITGSGHPKVSSLLTVALLPICVILNLRLIPPLGLTGAALASTFTFLLGTIGSYFIIYTKFKAGFKLGSTFRIISAAIVILILNFLLAKFGLPLLLNVAILLVCYLAALWILREWNFQQIRELYGQLSGANPTNPRKEN